MMELDGVFNVDSHVFEEILTELTPDRRTRFEASMAAIGAMALSRRSDTFILGKHLNDMLLCCEEQDPELAKRLPMGFHPDRFNMALRLYQRFRNFESIIGQIHVGVQLHVAKHSYCPDLMREIITLAREGSEVSMRDVQAITARIGIKVKPAKDNEKDDDDSLADLTDDATWGPDDDEAEAESRDDDTDPWDDDEPVISGAGRNGGATTKPPMKLENVDLADRREKLINNAMQELSGAIRSIDDFCAAYSIIRGRWWNHFHKGADLVLDGLREWKKSDVSQK